MSDLALPKSDYSKWSPIQKNGNVYRAEKAIGKKLRVSIEASSKEELQGLMKKMGIPALQGLKEMAVNFGVGNTRKAVVFVPSKHEIIVLGKTGQVQERHQLTNKMVAGEKNGVQAARKVSQLFAANTLQAKKPHPPPGAPPKQAMKPHPPPGAPPPKQAMKPHPPPGSPPKRALLAAKVLQLGQLPATPAGAQAKKVNGAVQRAYKEIARGCAKKVLFSEEDPDHVCYTPMNWLRKREIQAELGTVKAIRMQLSVNKLIDFFVASKKLGTKENCAVLANALMKKYGTIEKLIEELPKQDVKSLSEQVDQPANKLLKIFKDPSNAAELQKIVKSGGDIAMNFEEVQESERIEGDYTVRTDRAEHDLEKRLLKKEIPYPVAQQLGLQMARGLANMHKSGRVHGDLKLENVLVYEDPRSHRLSVKISDFGKTEPLGKNEDVMSTGNPRYLSFEGRLNMKGEVLSLGVLLIALFEKEFLSKKKRMLIEPTERDPSANPKASRWGIEEYLIVNKAFPNTDNATLMAKIKLVARQVKLVFTGMTPPTDLKNADREMKRYIDVLLAKLQKKYPGESKKNIELCKLLEHMTKVDRRERPSGDEVVIRLANILKKPYLDAEIY